MRGATRDRDRTAARGVRQLSTDTSEVKRDLRRLDDRLFQLMLLTGATLATTIATLVANLLS